MACSSNLFTDETLVSRLDLRESIISFQWPYLVQKFASASCKVKVKEFQLII